MNENILFKKVASNLLINVLNKENNLNVSYMNITRIVGKSFDLQYCYKLISLFVSSGLLTKKEVDSRSFDLILTDKGKTLAYNLNKIKNLLNEVEQNV